MKKPGTATAPGFFERFKDHSKNQQAKCLVRKLNATVIGIGIGLPTTFLRQVVLQLVLGLFTNQPSELN